MSLLEERQQNAPEKIKEIVALITEELEVYPGDEAMHLIRKLLDIIDAK